MLMVRFSWHRRLSSGLQVAGTHVHTDRLTAGLYARQFKVPQMHTVLEGEKSILDI